LQPATHWVENYKMQELLLVNVRLNKLKSNEEKRN
jgi:hypothetical protein